MLCVSSSSRMSCLSPGYIFLPGGRRRKGWRGGKNGYEGEEGSAKGKKRKAPPCTVLCTRHSIPFPFLSLSLLPFLVHTHTSSAAPYPHPPFRGGGRGKGRKVGGRREGGWAFVCWAASEEDGTKRGEGGSAIQGAQESKERKHKCICLSCTYVRVLKTRFRIRDTR